MASEEFGGLTMVAVALLEWEGEFGKTTKSEGDGNVLTLFLRVRTTR